MKPSVYLQTEYSMQQSTLSLSKIFKHAKNKGYDTLFIADKNLSGMFKVLKEAKNHQISITLGLEVEANYNHEKLCLVFYAKNDDELKELMRLSTFVETTPKFEFEDLLTHSKKLNLLLPTNQKIFFNLNLDESDLFKNIIQHTKQLILGIDDLSLEHPLWKSILKTYQLNWIPFKKMAYLNQKEKESYLLLRKISNAIIDDNIDLEWLDFDVFIKPFNNKFNMNNFKIIEGKYSFIENKHKLPKYPTKDNLPSFDYLKLLAHKGLEKRLKSKKRNHKIYLDRLNHELNVIHEMGYADYFLIVYDFVLFAKTNGILVGPGRGSAAGSLVAYVLGITDVDPIEYDLLFERFLNIERRTMPDIDLDFADRDRDKVIEYVVKKYGKEHVITITTFQTLQERSSLRDISRVLGLSNQRATAIIKAIEKNILDETDYEASKVVELAKTIEGLPRQTGTHAAGIILAEENLLETIPLQLGPHQMYQSQFEASDLEALGFLKIDFLGLRNLTIIDDLYKIEDLKFRLSEIPLNDKKTFEMIQKGDTTGIFQLESIGMRQVISKMKPRNFEDIVALLALYRPGPMQFIDTYIKRMNGESYSLVDPSIDDILKPTFGIIVYQEQIMKIAQTFAGYTLADADLLRRAIAKKDKETLEKEENRFIEKAIKNGKDEKLAKKIFSYIFEFSDYGFNRSHSVAYALLAYQMAYLKAHYFKSFMSVLMTHVQSNQEQIIFYKQEIEEHQIELLPPSIHESTTEFLSHKNGILMPLSSIKGIGYQTALSIINERNKARFINFENFISRMKGILNQKQIIYLIHSGALDSFGVNHHTMIENSHVDQLGFKDFLDDFVMIKKEEYSFDELTLFEKESLGFNILYQPENYIKRLEKLNQVKPFDPNTYKCRFIGEIIRVKEIRTKNGEPMAFLTIGYSNIMLDGVIFPNIFNTYRHLLDEKYIIINAMKKDGQYIIDKLEKVKEL